MDFSPKKCTIYLGEIDPPNLVFGYLRQYLSVPPELDADTSYSGVGFYLLLELLKLLRFLLGLPVPHSYLPSLFFFFRTQVSSSTRPCLTDSFRCSLAPEAELPFLSSFP